MCPPEDKGVSQFPQHRLRIGGRSRVSSGLSVRLEFFNAVDGNRLAASYSELAAMLNALINSLDGEP
jgi:hypothetical protein